MIKNFLYNKDINQVKNTDLNGQNVFENRSGTACPKRRMSMNNVRLYPILFFLVWLPVGCAVTGIQSVSTDYSESYSDPDAYFLEAVRNNNIITVMRFVEEQFVHVDTEDSYRWTALMYAVQHNQAGMAEYLLLKGANPNHRGYQGRTALSIALNHDYTVMTDLLLAYDVDLSLRYDNNFSPLLMAAYLGNSRLVGKMAGKGADLNSQNDEGTTALMMAVRDHHLSLLAALLSLGANPNIRDNKGRTSLHWAVSENDPDVVKQLIDAGADTDVQNDDMAHTPLMQAVYWGYEDMALYLIKDARAGLNFQDKNGMTGLMLAIYYNRINLVPLFIEKGAELDRQDKTGRSALMLAIDLNQTDAAARLIRAGANADLADHKGDTARKRIEYRGDAELIQLLEAPLSN